MQNILARTKGRSRLYRRKADRRLRSEEGVCESGERLISSLVTS